MTIEVPCTDRLIEVAGQRSHANAGKAPKLSDADIATIEQWVKAGAVMPDDPPAAQ